MQLKTNEFVIDFFISFLNIILIIGISLLIIGKFLSNNFIELSSYIFFFIFGLASFSFKIDLRLIKPLILTLIFFLIPLIIHFYLFRDSVLIYLMHYLVAIFIAFFGCKNFQNIRWDFLVYVTCFLSIILALISGTGGSNDSFNRTYLSVPPTILLFSSSFSDYHKGLRFNPFPLAVYMLTSIATLNRTSFLLASFLLIIYFFYFFTKKKQTSETLFLKIVSIIFLFLLLPIGAQFIQNIEIFNRLAERGLETGRFGIWLWYIETSASYNLFFGDDVDNVLTNVGNIFFNSSKPHSLHNIFFQLHLQGGIITLIFLVYIFYNFFKRAKYGKDWVMLAACTFLLLIKSMFDIAMFPQYTDFIILAAFFFSFISEKSRAFKK